MIEMTIIKRVNYPNGVSEEYELHAQVPNKNKKFIKKIFGKNSLISSNNEKSNQFTSLLNQTIDDNKRLLTK
jgi:hypothetical protein